MIASKNSSRLLEHRRPQRLVELGNSFGVRGERLQAARAAATARRSSRPAPSAFGSLSIRRTWASRFGASAASCRPGRTARRPACCSRGSTTAARRADTRRSACGLGRVAAGRPARRGTGIRRHQHRLHGQLDARLPLARPSPRRPRPASRGARPRRPSPAGGRPAWRSASGSRAPGRASVLLGVAGEEPALRLGPRVGRAFEHRSSRRAAVRSPLSAVAGLSERDGDAVLALRERQLRPRAMPACLLAAVRDVERLQLLAVDEHGDAFSRLPPAFWRRPGRGRRSRRPWTACTASAALPLVIGRNLPALCRVGRPAPGSCR